MLLFSLKNAGLNYWGFNASFDEISIWKASSGKLFVDIFKDRTLSVKLLKQTDFFYYVFSWFRLIN